MNLVKYDCCSFYGSILWKCNTPEFDQMCKTWNIAMRTLLKLPYNTRTSYLCPLIGQLYLRQQLYIRPLLLWHVSRLSNGIVKICIDTVRFTSNAQFGYEISFLSKYV